MVGVVEVLLSVSHGVATAASVRAHLGVWVDGEG